MFGNKSSKGKLKSFRYSPGYSDMRGASHSDILEMNEDGKWVIVSRNRDYYNEPVRVTTYAVSSEAEAQFEEFIGKKNLISLSKRLKSKLFIHDHSPWCYEIEYDFSGTGGNSSEDYRIHQYKVYTKADLDLLSEVREMFCSLKGDIISEETEKTEE